MLYPLLVEKISGLLIVDYYNDTRRVGRDDITRDFYLIFYFEDYYLQNCVEKGLKANSKSVEGSYSNFTCFKYDYDPSAVTARFPRAGHIFDFDSQKLRLYLLQLCIPYYNLQDHREYIQTEQYKQSVTKFYKTKVRLNFKEKDYERQITTTVKAEIFDQDTGSILKDFDIVICDKNIMNSKIESLFRHLYNSITL